jgi:hypothetical protein
LDGFALEHNELLLFLDVRVKSVKQKVNGPAFFLGDDGDSSFVVTDVLGLDDTNAGLPAFVHKVS